MGRKERGRGSQGEGVEHVAVAEGRLRSWPKAQVLDELALEEAAGECHLALPMVEIVLELALVAGGEGRGEVGITVGG